ncbi:MAG: hypothetical protein ACP5P3_03315 [Ignavibacteria bacterium]
MNTKKVRFLIILLINLLFAIQLFAQNTPSIEIKANKKSFKPGQNGTLSIKFKVSDNIKIPKEPQIEVTITGNNITGLGLEDYTKGEGEYLKNPVIKYKFKIENGATAGTKEVQVKIKFSYCNYNTGICKFAEKTKTVKIKVSD